MSRREQDVGETVIINRVVSTYRLRWNLNIFEKEVAGVVLDACGRIVGSRAETRAGQVVNGFHNQWLRCPKRFWLERKMAFRLSHHYFLNSEQILV